MSTLTNYVLVKGILKPEIKAQKSEFLGQALAEIQTELNLVVNRYVGDNLGSFSPNEFAPAAIEFEVLMSICEQIRLLGDQNKEQQAQLNASLKEPLS